MTGEQAVELLNKSTLEDQVKNIVSGLELNKPVEVPGLEALTTKADANETAIANLQNVFTEGIEKIQNAFVTAQTEGNEKVVEKVTGFSDMVKAMQDKIDAIANEVNNVKTKPSGGKNNNPESAGMEQPTEPKMQKGIKKIILPKEWVNGVATPSSHFKN